jgi:hypothetical protein
MTWRVVYCNASLASAWVPHNSVGLEPRIGL